MTLGYPPNEIPPEVLERSYRANGREITEKLCVIGDFTNSNERIDSYLAERVVQLWEIGYESSNIKTKERSKELIKKGLNLLLSKHNKGDIERLIAEEYSRRLKLIGIEVKIEKIPLERIMSLKKLI
ncbi:hypothetical protein DRN86_04970 [Candidatus Geothermarchaeota archaeon]|nr:MAG: hypothetical protein DRN86_04970 [Candidatus Geothermarchaeota archaeon]